MNKVWGWFSTFLFYGLIPSGLLVVGAGSAAKAREAELAHDNYGVIVNVLWALAWFSAFCLLTRWTYKSERDWEKKNTKPEER